jgi:hypothetical protein
MHRSGTSTVARAINLLGAYLGESKDLGTANEDNPEGYWERPDITSLNDRLLRAFGRRWDSVAPVPAEWRESFVVGPFRKEIMDLIRSRLAGQPLWAWKDPRTCLVFSLWRDVLNELGVDLCSVFVVRSPLDVANSLKRRDGMRLGQALGLWFNYNLSALQASRALPITFLSYDRLLESWEPELRRCANALKIPWPEDEQSLDKAMNSFIRPKLRHSQTTLDDLREAPGPVQELYGVLLEVLKAPPTVPERFFEVIDRLSRDFQGYSSFFEGGLDNAAIPQAARPHYLQRTWWRWKRSIRKRLGPAKGSIDPKPAASLGAK